MKAPGADELSAYRAYRNQDGSGPDGSGLDLFRAYLARRGADKDAARARMKRLHEMLERGLTEELHEAVRAEMLMLRILDELDPVISDLVKVCERPPGKDDVLAELRSALRLGKGRAKTDTELAWERWRAVPLWIQAYNEIERTRTDRADNQIAREIAQALDISPSTALRHWDRYAAELPHQADWVKQIRARLRARKSPKK